ncbi:hypothetical protein GCM10009641_00290 [Mycobacterium cookii]|uniref:Uncharacterized protein n=1 Tax=Mycobacterium cookii TaxID=1775 RepID=A0A7I7L3H5_9MYCO|nr:hypothetical protein MCOO_49400 [Mycobacterium cookii]
MFCRPSDRPLQNGPAYSVIAVDSNPLSSTATTAAATISGTAINKCRWSATANMTRISTAATAIMRTGRSRDPTRSDHRPTKIRPTAPSTCDTVTTHPAATIEHR